MRWKAGEDMSLELEIMTRCMFHGMLSIFIYVVLTHGFVLLAHTPLDPYKLFDT
jgi:hypothetical protein